MTDAQDLITFVDPDGNPVRDPWPDLSHETLGKRMAPVFAPG